jgi:hypothetical protein
MRRWKRTVAVAIAMATNECEAIMPYKVKKVSGGYKVTSANHPGGFSREPMSLERAKAQQAALYVHADPKKEKKKGK